MALASIAPALRRHLVLAVSVVVVALSVLAMHELSLEHTLARPGPVSQVAAHHDHDHIEAAGSHVEVASVGPGTSDACPGCGDHHVMTATCLIALILLVTGWLLRGPPLAVRQVRISRVSRHELPPALRRRPPARSWIELSVSRT